MHWLASVKLAPLLNVPARILFRFDDDRLTSQITRVRGHDEAPVLLNFRDTAGSANFDSSRRAFFQKHINDLVRRPIAEQLSKLLFVKSDPMAADHGDEIFRCVLRQ